MNEKEIQFFLMQLSYCNNYLEFGSGNSTLLVINNSTIKNIVSVEADFEFWNKLFENNNEIQIAIKTQRLTSLLINIGQTGEWSYPIDNSEYHNYPNYSSIPYNHNRTYDLVLIDGRFRVACALHCCLDLSEDTRVLIHDFTDRTQ